MGKRDPTWLPEARQFCRDSGIKIMAWGPDLLTVEAKSTERAKEIVSKLGQLGFKVVEDEDDSYAGMLSLSLNPAAVKEKIVSFDVSRRPWIDLIEPLIWVFWFAIVNSRSLRECWPLSKLGHHANRTLVGDLIFLGRRPHVGLETRHPLRGASSPALLSMEHDSLGTN